MRHGLFVRKTLGRTDRAGGVFILYVAALARHELSGRSTGGSGNRQRDPFVGNVWISDDIIADLAGSDNKDQSVIMRSGKNASAGGQAQRISIARCILKDAPVIILDEATASMDADNEAMIQQALSELCKDKTTIVIAHRLHTVRHADKLLVIKEGNIIEQGNHDELLAKKGVYYQMLEAENKPLGW